MMKVLLLISSLFMQSNGLDIRGIKCESDGKNTTLTFFDQWNHYGWKIDFDVHAAAKKVYPQAIPREPLAEPEPEMVTKMQSRGPILTWVSLKQPDRDVCTHYFSVFNGTWGNWGYLKWYYSYPKDDLPMLREMSERTAKDRKIYFATHVIDSQCHYKVFYYGTSWSHFWSKMRGYLYGFNWDPDDWQGLDSMEGLNGRIGLYPRFILMPGVFPAAVDNESMIFYNNRAVGFGSARSALNVNDHILGEDIEVKKLVPEKGNNIPYHRDMTIHADVK